MDLQKFAISFHPNRTDLVEYVILIPDGEPNTRWDKCLKIFADNSHVGNIQYGEEVKIEILDSVKFAMLFLSLLPK
jgi:hypothetical protein